LSAHHGVNGNRRKHSLEAYFQYLLSCRIMSSDKAGTDYFWRQNWWMLFKVLFSHVGDNVKMEGMDTGR